MDLVIVLLLFVLELQMERHLISLVDHIAMTLRHPPDMKAQHPWNWTQIFLGPGEQIFDGIGDFRFRPENDNMGKHSESE
jgi:hypothetical protein